MQKIVPIEPIQLCCVFAQKAKNCYNKGVISGAPLYEQLLNYQRIALANTMQEGRISCQDKLKLSSLSANFAGRFIFVALKRLTET